MRKTEDARDITRFRRGIGIVSQARRTMYRRRSSIPGLRSLVRDTRGQALLEAVIVLPVLFIFILVIMEISMLYNAKQLANHSAFCAARTAAVYGVDSTAKTHLAAAIVMSAISSTNAGTARDIMRAFGVDDPDATIGALCSIPGFQGQNAAWLGRVANAYLRTGAPACTVGTAPGKTRQYVIANVTYIYRCNFWPFGIVWGQAGIEAYLAYLQAFPYYNGYTYNVVVPFMAILKSTWRSNIRIHGRAVTDYWAG